MIPSQFFLRFCASLLLGLVVSAPSWAETWTDSSGKFSVEAKFIGVEGKSIVLRKPDGKTLNVPISRLSAESRTLAKRLYDQLKSGGSDGSALPNKSTAAEPLSAADMTAPAKPLNFTPPAPPTIPPLPPFPENASLQETVDFVTTQIMAGHPEVFWHALPASICETLDSVELRNKLDPFMQEQAGVTKQVEGVVMKAIEVLVTKKDFMINSPLMQQVPPPFVPTVQQAYDPAVGLIFEISVLSFSNVSLAERSISEMVDDHGPRVGAHLQALLKIVPRELVDGALAAVTVEETGSTGTITVPNSDGETDTIEMVRYDGRWVPKDIAESWDTDKDAFIASMVDDLNNSKQQGEAAGQQAAAMVGVFAMMANTAIDPMLAATTQEEFDQAIMKILAMLPNMGGLGGLGPENLGAGGPGPGGIDAGPGF